MDKIRVAKVDNVVLDRSEYSHQDPKSVPRRQRLTGTLHLTTHHLIFSPTATSSASTAEIWIPYPTITLMTRLPQSIQGLYPVQIRTRLFDNYVLLFEKDRQGGAEDVWQSVRDCAVVASVEQLYGFCYSLPHHDGSNSTSSLPPQPGDPASGWNVYNPRSEFARQGLGSRTKAWRFTDINKDYSFCPTYPNKLVVPSRISDSVLAYAGKYRSKGRIPALAYLHWANHASITRSSQPMVGLKNARSAQDERLVECIFTAHLFLDTAYNPTAAPSASPQTHVYGATSTNLIIDARPTANAMANVAVGAGTENMDNYRSGKKAYLGIDNIHVMRNSLKTIAEAIYEVEENPSATLDRGLLRKSNWLRHISTLLDGTMIIVKNIHLNASHVLIHCSDGWDRTSQLSATAQICLDPYFRTIDGLCVLIEKDWLSFGHKFLDRSGHLSSEKLFTVADSPENDSDDELGGAQRAAQAFFASMQKQFTSNNHMKEVSPVFHQFLDSVWQIQRQFPDRFEYNEDLLIELHTQLYSCQYGTFLFNNERQRRVSDTGKPYVERTVSFWEQLHREREKYKNPRFDPQLDDRSQRNSDSDQGVLMPDPKDVRFWYRLFKRGDEEMNGSPIALQQAQGAELLGPVGAGQVDPISVEGALREIPAALSRNSSPAPRGAAQSDQAERSTSFLSPVASSPARTPKPNEDAQGGWRWSQISSGAFSAIQGAARDFKSIGQEAINQKRNDTEKRNGEMAPKQDELPYVPRPRPTPRIPSEANPWSVDPPQQPRRARAEASSRNPWDDITPAAQLPSLDRLTLTPQPALNDRKKQEVADEEMRAALGGDQKAWDPLGAL